MKTYYVRFGSGDPRTFSALAPTFLTFNTYGTAVTPPGITSVIGATGFYAFQYGVTTPIVFLIDGATTGLDNSVRYVVGAIDPADRSDEYNTTLTAMSTSLLAQSSTLFSLGTSGIALGSTNVALGTLNLAQGTSIVAIGVTGLAYDASLISLGNTAVALGMTISSLIAQGTTNTAELLLRVGTTLSSFGSTSVDPGDLFGFLKRAQEFREGDQSFAKTTGQWDISTRGGTLLISKSLSNSSTAVTKS